MKEIEEVENDHLDHALFSTWNAVVNKHIC